MYALTLEEVEKSFASTHAVDKLSAYVPTGSIYGFLGPNGAGKTTTIRMIMDIIRPDAGKIAVFDGMSAAGAKHRIGYMPEERGLYPKMRVTSALAYIGAIKGMPRRDIGPAIDHWLEVVGLKECALKRIEELSRGMHQKIQFVATVLNNPDFLILDEPFSGLDPVNLEVLKEIVLRLREEGKTVVFSTHIMEQAEQMCDSILLINKGKAVIDGSLASIRDSYSLGTVIVEAEEGMDGIAELPMVQSVRQQNRHAEVTLHDGADPQALLEALVGRMRIRRFEVKVPTLHEIVTV